MRAALITVVITLSGSMLGLVARRTVIVPLPLRGAAS